MKILAAFLMLMIVLHSACLAQCVAGAKDAPKDATAPPCDHHQSRTPGNPAPSIPSTTCAEGPALEAKTSPIVKCALGHPAVKGIVLTTRLFFHDRGQMAQQYVEWPPSPFFDRTSALRI